MKLKISPNALKKIGDNLALGCVHAKLTGPRKQTELWQKVILPSAEKIIKKVKVEYPDVKDVPGIKGLRQAYSNCGVSLSVNKGSNEAMFRRVKDEPQNNYCLPKVNTIVDINTIMSLKSTRSVGCYDLKKLKEEIEFRLGVDEENYKKLDNRTLQLKNLPIFCDTDGPFGSPTADSQRALVSDDTQELLLVIISFDGESQLDEQLLEASELLQNYAGASHIQTAKLNAKDTEFFFKKNNQENNNNVITGDFTMFAKIPLKPLLAQSTLEKQNQDILIKVPLSGKLYRDMHFDHKVLTCIEQLNRYLQAHCLLNEGIKVSGLYNRNFNNNDAPPQTSPPFFLSGQLTLEENNFVLRLSKPQQKILIEDVAKLLNGFQFESDFFNIKGSPSLSNHL